MLDPRCLRFGAAVSAVALIIAFLTGTLVGSPDTVVAHLAELDRAGAYGVLFALPDPRADVRGSAEWKRQVVRVFTRRALAAAA